MPVQSLVRPSGQYQFDRQPDASPVINPMPARYQFSRQVGVSSSVSLVLVRSLFLLLVGASLVTSLATRLMIVASPAISPVLVQSGLAIKLAT